MINMNATVSVTTGKRKLESRSSASQVLPHGPFTYKHTHDEVGVGGKPRGRTPGGYVREILEQK